MGEKLTKRDVEKIEQEIEHRKLVVRKEAIEAVKEARAQGISAKTLNIMRQNAIRTRTKAVSVTWKGC